MNLYKEFKKIWNDFIDLYNLKDLCEFLKIHSKLQELVRKIIKMMRFG